MSRRLRDAIGWIGYFAAFVFFTFPLVRHAASRVPARFGPDLEHSLWVQWWFATALGSGQHEIFRSRMVAYPQSVDLQLADLNLAVNAAFWALGAELTSAAASWNLLLLAAFLLAAGLTWRFATRLGASRGAGWLGGLFFAASPYWMASALNGWCYLVHTWTLPLVGLAALALRAAPGLRSGAGLGVALALAFHVTPYYLLYAAVLLAVLAMLHPREVRACLGERSGWLAVAAALLVLGVLVGPRVAAMAAVASQHELEVHHGPLNTALALPLVELVWPSWSAVTARQPRLGYLVGFLGWTLLGAIALSAWRSGRGTAAGVHGWLVAASLLLLLALGPQVVVASGWVTQVPGPGALLQRLPVFDLTTNHWRWSLPAGLCLAVALARSLSAWERRLTASGSPWGHALVPLLALAWAVEVAWVWPLPYPRPLWQVQASPVAALLRDRGDVSAVLDRTDRRKLNQMVHGKPIALGWLPRVTRETQQANAAMVAACEEGGLPCLREHGIDAVIRDDHTAVLLDRDGAVREVLHSRDGSAPGPSPSP